MNKERKSFIFNLLIVVFEIAGLLTGIIMNHRISYEYFTEESNILALIMRIVK